uniref:non-specific serine/threonine protein kinase n=1 Tax=Vitis vinifera TaxID=29760 RepID=A5B4V8_VITVI|nr:CBL-interacting protein kinase 06 [Vitis vinifera]ACQ83522.1 CBL-interacting protein kinase 06 [Vitis vinifera]CAN78654.1 hypothetical protein VITISV_040990 [Vitis vinifera]
MGVANNIGKYQLSRTIGEGTFAKVKLAVNTENGQYVAIKIIDKHMVMENNLIFQVQREIRTMKLLHHPNIVRIHEVIGTKTKIYIVMEYVSGGQLSDKMSYVKKLDEQDARKHFQQLIDAVDYCHGRGVYHRDLKLLANRGYDGAAADIWSCGVILFELLAGYLPFDDRNLMSLYKKITRAEYTCPEWFTPSQTKLISRILDPNPRREPASGIEFDDKINLDDVHAAFNLIEENNAEAKVPHSSFINAFQLIAMSHDLDLSGLFEEKDDNKQKARFGSKHTIDETIKKIEAAAKDVSLSVERKNSKVQQSTYDPDFSEGFSHIPAKLITLLNTSDEDASTTEDDKMFSIIFQPISRGNLVVIFSHSDTRYQTLTTECVKYQVIEVAPTHCVVEISKSAGELGVYKEASLNMYQCKKRNCLNHNPGQDYCQHPCPHLDTKATKSLIGGHLASMREALREGARWRTSALGRVNQGAVLTGTGMAMRGACTSIIPPQAWMMSPPKTSKTAQNAL